MTEKNETLLEYAKENIDKNADSDAKLLELEKLRQSAESQLSFNQEKANSLQQELAAKKSLLDQVKQNLEEIRSEKIAM